MTKLKKSYSIIVTKIHAVKYKQANYGENN